jgi:putative ABC transport system permease protein
MKYLPLIWSTLWRRKARTIFTLLAIVVAFLMFGTLRMIGYALDHPSEANGQSVLITVSKYSITISLPFADLEQIRAVPGVQAVTWLTWFGGYYQESKNFVFAVPVDIDSYLAMHDTELEIDPAQIAAFKQNRSGTLVSDDLMKKFGWKLGERIPIHSTIWAQRDGSLDWTFEIVGTFTAKDPTLRSQQASMLLFPYETFEQGRTFGKNTVGWFQERIGDPSHSAEIAEKIDALFANSANETKTQPSKDFAAAFIKQLGDIGFILRAILGAVFFTLLFLTGNTMMQSVRERIGELAVFKTLGFTNGTVMGLVLGESLLLCMFAATIGLLLSLLMIPVLRMGLQGVDISPLATLPGLGVAALLAIFVGALPAWRAVRLDIVDALRA